MRYDVETEAVNFEKLSTNQCRVGESIQYVFRQGRLSFPNLFEELPQLLNTTKGDRSLIRIMTPVFNMSRQILKIMCRHIEIPLRRSLAVTKTLTLRL
jgi:lipopolysaccharide/colanic/teichoic acid biosynthesis glycosyltransferase